MTKLHTVKQQLVFLRRKERTHTLCSTHTPEPFTLRLDAQQRARLQQQLQQVQSAAAASGSVCTADTLCDIHEEKKKTTLGGA